MSDNAMRHVAALLLARLGGNENPDAAAIKKIIEAGGGTVDDASLTFVLDQLKGKSVDEVIAEGLEKLASVPSGGGGGGGGGGAAPAAAGGAPAAAAAAPKEEEKKEASEEEGMDFGLFD